MLIIIYYPKIAIIRFKKYISTVTNFLNFRYNWFIVAIGTYSLLLTFNALGYSSWLPSCPINQITGVNCLGCGMNRAAIELLKGNWLAAYQYNALIYGYLFLGLIWIILKISRYKHSSTEKNPI